ncbi:ribonuclease HII [Candidatus Saccharibacteria bacterium]|nr:ribonuclease HII [Candidatus Saccharibacteria bacterium]
MKRTLGIDEVGRGPLAGPIVVAAVVLGEVVPEGLNDSKKLTAKRREQLAREIKRTATGIGIGWVSAKILDKIGITESLKLASRLAVEQVEADYDQIIIDGTINFLPERTEVTTMVKADGRIKAVSAASIIAKVARDNYMKKCGEIWGVYGFDSHVGYGSAAHMAAIKKHGASPIHRLSFAPFNVRERPAKIQNTIGRQAENLAVEYLETLGHEVLEQNWKTKICEIDIISKKADSVYFHEVKYRKNAGSGSGLDVITKKKLEQMKKGVALWRKANFAEPKDDQYDYTLAVVAMTGNPCRVDQYLELETARW